MLKPEAKRTDVQLFPALEVPSEVSSGQVTERAVTPAVTPATAGRVQVGLAVRMFRPLAKAYLWAGGWRIDGDLPDIPKYIVVAAPHTTNWDLPNALSAGLHWGQRIHWMGKHTLFRWPFGGFMRWLGGVSIDRSKNNNVVQQMIDWFGSADRLVLVITPSGTRSATAKWKTGFWHIAMGAGVPIVLCYIDYNRRLIGMAQVFQPTGDLEADITAIEAVYAPISEWSRKPVKP